MDNSGGHLLFGFLETFAIIDQTAVLAKHKKPIKTTNQKCKLHIAKFASEGNTHKKNDEGS